MKKTTLSLVLLFCLVSLFSLAFLVFSQNKNAKKKTPLAKLSQVVPSTKKPVLGTISVNLYATADSSIDSSHPTTNYGGSTSIAAGYYPPPTEQKLRFLVKFDLSLIPSNATINSAVLSLYQWWGTGTPSLNWLVAGQTSSSWTEYGVNWDNRPGYYTNVRSTIAACEGCWGSFDVKPIVSEWVSGAKANHGFMIVASESGNYWYRYFNSREAESNKPYLLINYTLPDTTPPTISNIATSEITKTSVKITWATNEASTSYVNYGPTATYGVTTGQADSVTSHSVPLGGLLPGQTYHFRVRSKDAANNEAVSGDYTFKTATDTTAGLGVNQTSPTSGDTGSNTSATTPSPSNLTLPTPKQSTNSATAAEKKIATPSTTGKGKAVTKFAGIKAPILIVLAILVVLVIATLVYFLKFRHKPSLKEVDTKNKPL